MDLIEPYFGEKTYKELLVFKIIFVIAPLILLAATITGCFFLIFTLEVDNIITGSILMGVGFIFFLTIFAFALSLNLKRYKYLDQEVITYIGFYYRYLIVNNVIIGIMEKDFTIQPISIEVSYNGHDYLFKREMFEVKTHLYIDKEEITQKY